MERDMFDTMTLTKLGGGLFGTFLVFLLAGWLAETIYVAAEHEGDQQAYVIELPDSGGETVEAEAEVPFEEVFASADAAAGEGVFRNCRACHAIEADVNGTGPTLYGVVGRAVDSVPGYAYSGALEQVAEVWDPEHLNGFLAAPQDYAPGTKMSYQGLRSIEDRANLIAWLDTLDN